MGPGRAEDGEGLDEGAAGEGTGEPAEGAGTDGPAVGDGAVAGALGATGLAAALRDGLAGAGGSPASFSFRRRSTGASTVEDAERTNSPMSFNMVRTVLLSTPSSFASS